eukprot:gene43096-53886_t
MTSVKPRPPNASGPNGLRGGIKQYAIVADSLPLSMRLKVNINKLALKRWRATEKLGALILSSSVID